MTINTKISISSINWIVRRRQFCKKSHLNLKISQKVTFITIEETREAESCYELFINFLNNYWFGN